MPVNVCYAAVYPILYNKGIVDFCDVEPSTGNVNCLQVKSALEQEKFDAVLVPHMYGNPVKELPQIAQLCKERGVLLIEDCACAMGAYAPYPLGEIGDYAVYSTGPAKLLDLDYGGLLYSSADTLEWVDREAALLPLYSKRTAEQETLFSKVYRVLREYGTQNSLTEGLYRAMCLDGKDMFLFRLGHEQVQEVEKALLQIQCLANQRRQMWNRLKYMFPLKWEVYDYPEGSVPWRFSVLCPPENKCQAVEACLKKGLAVSDWYPQTAPMFGEWRGRWPGATWMEQRILNFPLEERTEWETWPLLNHLFG